MHRYLLLTVGTLPLKAYSSLMYYFCLMSFRKKTAKKKLFSLGLFIWHELILLCDKKKERLLAA
jgi:hypothetical protein